jgi:hypothetical protein
MQIARIVLKSSAQQFDDKQYWKNRHAQTSNLKASGIKSVGVKSNQYVYKMLEEQYTKLLNEIGVSKLQSVLDCGFGDGYFLKFYKDNFPHLKIHGVDISEEAKNKIDFIDKDRLHVCDLASFSPAKKFDIVHCFDVLYHILNTDDHVQVLKNLASWSDKYIILHERFFKKVPVISSKHVRMRRSEFTNQVLNSKGFFLSREIPSHFFAMKFLTYKLNKYAPSAFYKLDKYVAQTF